MAASPGEQALRGQLTYEMAQDFQLAWESVISKGPTFVPLDGAATVGQAIVVHFAIADVAQTDAGGVIEGVETDSAGRPGVNVRFDAPALTELGALADQMWAFAVDVSDTTQIKKAQAQAALEADAQATGPLPLGSPTAPMPAGSPTAPMPAGTPTGPLPVTDALGSAPLPQLSTPSGIAAAPSATALLPQDTRLEPGVLLDGRFQIEAFVASGGMGDVYRATHVFLKRSVALKLLRSIFAKDQEMWARFQREAELVSKLESPHVVRVFDFGRITNGAPFLAMEYVEGTTLDSLLEREGPMPPARAVGVLSQVLDGLAEAHAMGIIHRDLKPPNIILGRKRDGAEIAKILDFGIARIADNAPQGGSVTQQGMVVGTPAYLAPEQALAGSLDARTDIYAMGCVAYELLTGRPPFRSESLHRVVSMQLTERPAPLEQWQPALKAQRALTQVVLKALEKEPAKRFQSADELRKALEAAIGTGAAATPVEQQAPVPAQPDPWSTTPLPQPNPLPVPKASPPPDAAADDFFSMNAAPAASPASGAKGKPAAASSAPAPSALALQLGGLGITLAPPKLEALRTAKEALPHELDVAHVVQAEILRADARSPGWIVAATILLETMAEWGAALETADEDGFSFLFRAAPPRAAAMAATLARERIEGAMEPTSPRLRAALTQGRVVRLEGGPASGDVLRRARAWIARVPAGAVVASRALVASLGETFERKDASGVDSDAIELGDRRAPAAKQTPLIHREAVLQSLDKRLSSLAQGVVAPVVLIGPSGCGRTSLATELATRARKQSLLVAQAASAPLLRGSPFAALSEIICQLCGVPLEQRHDQLATALGKLKVTPSEREAAMVIALGRHTPAPFTAKQAVHSLRAVMAAGAMGRRTVLIFDGVEQMDAASVEAFRELCTRPGMGELTVGFTDHDTAAERLTGLPTLDVPTFGQEQVRSYLSTVHGLEVDATLLDHLTRSSRGLPGVLADWVAWLDAKGRLGTATADAELPYWDDRQLAAARLITEGYRLVRVLACMALAQEPVDSGFLKKVSPDAPPSVFQRLVAHRLVRQAGSRRWTVASHRHAAMAIALDDHARPAFALRIATTLAEQAKASGERPDIARLSALLAQGHDGVRAIQGWKAAAEDAMARRSPRDLMHALGGWADALGLLEAHAQSAEAAKGRVELLARAVGNALVINDAAGARALLDTASELAQRLQVSSAEHFLVASRVLRTEARRARANEALAKAEQLAQGSPVAALCWAEQGDVKETEGDARGAAQAFGYALQQADAAAGLAKWHGEVDFRARLETRLAGIFLAAKDLGNARTWLQSALVRWRQAEAPGAEARVLANLGTLCVQGKELDEAAKYFEQAAAAAAKSGDLLFQAKQLLHLTRVLQRKGASPRLRQVAELTRTLSTQIGWDDGRQHAEALLRA